MKFIKSLYASLAVASLLVIGACDDQLDINDNPNAPINADVQLVLPHAIVASADVVSLFNNYGAHFGGYMANAGGFSGYGNLLNYNLTPVDWNRLWTDTYQIPLADLKYVIDNTEDKDDLAYFNAAAKIMMVMNYQKLVDAFGDIPYSQALRAAEGILTPKYDDAETIYRSLIASLDDAIATIDNAKFPLRLTRSADPLFGSRNSSERNITDQMNDWKRFANSLKLRMLMRLSDKTEFSAFLSQEFAKLDLGIGFLIDDAIVNPGYDLNKPNPAWNTWGRRPDLTLSNSSRLPTKFAFGFYDGAKLEDEARGEASFVNFPSTPVNQLGDEGDPPTAVAGQVTWASNEPGLSGIGILKGAGMGQPLMLLAELKLLVAEGQLKGYLPGDYSTTFYEGVRASFAYLYKNENGALALPAGSSLDDLVDNYIATNAGNHLAEIGVAGDDNERLEAIITQKYIALNMIHSDEAWNDYRRTGYPVSQPGGGGSFDIASKQSNVSTRADRMPTRILYPSSEQAYNAQNYVNIDHTSDLIFWDPN